MTVVGIDPSKELLALSLEGGKAQLRNSPSELEAWSKSLEPDTVVGIEATGRLHRAALAALAAAGIECYLLNPLHVSRYIRALRPSVKTDRSDAVMIARYLDRERDMLVAYKMPTAAIQELKDLLSYRETVMEKRVALRQSHSEQPLSSRAKQNWKRPSPAPFEKSTSASRRSPGRARSTSGSSPSTGSVRCRPPP
ncbi:MAG TPA: transposase [Fimbriimonadaceae bacterium]|nr:transposase [Fimbriimonadaceae bacterium]